MERSPRTSPPPSPDERGRRGYLIGAGTALVALLILGAGALVASHDSAHCGEGFVAIGARCCGDGQALDGARCVGKPTRCGAPLVATPDGCVAPDSVTKIAGGSLRALSLDWEAEGKTAFAETTIEPFRIDVFEVTWSRYASCATSGKCIPLTPIGEAGQPVNRVTAFEAARFCAFAGGRLPTRAQLSFAAAGADGRRFPWGPNGAVCRRAAWGLSDGPCSNGSTEPDVTGSHPDGATPDGVHDLAGNVAEWTLPRPDGFAVVLGGSFRDREASSLKTWASREMAADQRADDIGFRCVYDP